MPKLNDVKWVLVTLTYGNQKNLLEWNNRDENLWYRVVTAAQTIYLNTNVP